MLPSLDELGTTPVSDLQQSLMAWIKHLPSQKSKAEEAGTLSAEEAMENEGMAAQFIRERVNAFFGRSS